MKKNIDEKKIIFTLIFGLMMMAIAYFFGKKIGEYAKNNKCKDTSIENIIENSS